MQSCSICKGLLGAYYGYKTVQNIYYVTKEYVKYSFLFGFIKLYDTYKEKTVKNQEVKCCNNCATHNFSHSEVIVEDEDWNNKMLEDIKKDLIKDMITKLPKS